MASAYDASFARLCSGTIPIIVEAARSLPGNGRTLDVGTGTGSVAAALCAAGFDATGVDADAGMVAFAASRHDGAAISSGLAASSSGSGVEPGSPLRVDEESGPPLRFGVGALPSLPFRNDEFDLVAANFVVNHTLKPRAAMHDLARVTKPGGLVIATIWPSSPVSALNRLWGEVISRSRAVVPPGTRLPPDDDFERSIGGLDSLLAGSGLEETHAFAVSWEFRINADDLWGAAEAGIANIGGTYRHQDDAGRRAMRDVYGELTGWGELAFDAVAVVGRGRRQ